MQIRVGAMPDKISGASIENSGLDRYGLSRGIGCKTSDFPDWSIAIVACKWLRSGFKKIIHRCYGSVKVEDSAVPFGHFGLDDADQITVFVD